MDRVYDTRLANAIDTADSLLEPRRIPRQLEIDDPSAAMVQVQPFASRIGRQKNPTPAVGEIVDRRTAFVAREASVQHHHRLTKSQAEMQQGIAEFREDHDWLGDASEQPRESQHLGLGLTGPLRGVAKRAQQQSFPA